MTILDQYGNPIREAHLSTGSMFAPEPDRNPGWVDYTPLGRRVPDRFYGQTDGYARRSCNALYSTNGLFYAAVEIAASMLVGDEVSYGTVYDEGLQTIIEEFWAANTFDELLAERMVFDLFLDGEICAVWANGEHAGPRDLPARLAFLDPDTDTFGVKADTRYGATPSDMVYEVGLYPFGQAARTWQQGEFVWAATRGGRKNNPRGRPWAYASAEAAIAHINLLNLRLNVHEMQQRLLAVYHALFDPNVPDAEAKYRRKTAAFRGVPRDGTVVPMLVRPGYTDTRTGVKYDEVRETLEFLQPAKGAADAAQDMRHALRLVGLTMGGLPEHWMGEGGNANRATAGQMGDPLVHIGKRRQKLLRSVLQRMFMTEAMRRLGPDAKVQLKKRGRKVPLRAVDLPFNFPVLRAENLDLIIKRVQLGLTHGILSNQGAQSDLGYDSALERDRLDAQASDGKSQPPPAGQPNAEQGAP